MSPLGVEVDTGRGRHAGLGQHPATELPAVVREPRHIGEQVEGTVRRRQAIEARRRKPRQQQLPIPGIAPHIGVEFVAAVERSDGSVLGQRRRRNKQVLRQSLDRPEQLLRHDHPT